MDLYRKFVDADVEVVFVDDEEAYLLALKRGEALRAAIKVTVKLKNQLIATYHRQFPTLTPVHYHRFVKKFLENPDYRLPFVTKGSWNGTLSYETEGSVNPDTGVYVLCEAAIRRLNARTQPRSTDFTSLRAYGRDVYSNKKRAELERELPKYQVARIDAAFTDETMALSAMRWAGRGLLVEHAIRKVEVDEESKSRLKKQKRV